MPRLYFDIETGSPRSLHEHGAWAYAACPDTRIWCLCFAVNNGEVQSWTPGDPLPDVFTAIAADPTGWQIVAHGIPFRPCRPTFSTARCRWRWRTPIQRNWPDCAPRWRSNTKRTAKASY